MSHLRQITSPDITDLGALASAAQRRGGQMRVGPCEFSTYQSGQTADYVLSFDGCRYEVGVRGAKDGKFALVWDDFAPGGLKAKLGENAGLLIQAYATEVAIKAARRQGYSVTEQTQADGRILLRVNAGA